jgi:hypothetical protein
MREEERAFADAYFDPSDLRHDQVGPRVHAVPKSQREYNSRGRVMLTPTGKT